MAALAEQENASAGRGGFFSVETILLTLILAIGLLARLWSIDFGLPDTRCRPDESTLVLAALKFGSGDLNPHFFNYPSFYMYVLFAVYGLFYVFGKISGRFESPNDMLELYTLDPTIFYLLDRLLVAFLGTLTIYVVYRLARLLFDRTTGLIAAFLLSLAFLHVRSSHFGVTDVPSAFLMLTAVLFSARAVMLDSPKGHAIAGGVAGLATSTKYGGLFLAPAMVVARMFGGQRRGWSQLLDKKMLLFGIAFGLAFLAGTPYALLDFPTFISGFNSELTHLGAGHGIDLGRGWWRHLSFSLYHGLGWPVLAAAVAGLAWLARSRPRSAILLGSFPLLYYLIAGRGFTVFVRYAVPLVPFMVLFAAFLIRGVAGKLAPRRPGVVCVVLAMLIALPSARSIYHFNTLLGKTDNRTLATAWAQDNLEPGASVFQPLLWEKLHLRSTPQVLAARVAEARADGRTLETRKLELELRVLRDQGLPGWEEWTWDVETKGFLDRGQPALGLPRYFVTATSPLVFRNRAPAHFTGLLERSYRLLKAFEVIDIGSGDNLFDQQDAFYVPFAGFRNVERPGPNLYIYERLD